MSQLHTPLETFVFLSLSACTGWLLATLFVALFVDPFIRWAKPRIQRWWARRNEKYFG